MAFITNTSIPERKPRVITAEVQTVGASTEPLFTFTTGTDAQYFWVARIVMRTSDGVDFAGFERKGQLTYSAGNPSFSVRISTTYTEKTATEYNVVYNNSGSTAELRVVGRAGKTANWSGTMTLQEIGS